MDAVARPRSSSSSLTTALIQLHNQLENTPLRLDVPDAAALRAERDEMAEQLGDYVLPRMLQQDAPLLAVVGGSTGAGKSTLVNSLIRERVSASGVLRPTTRSPVLVHHPDDAAWFEAATLLPDLARTTQPINDGKALHLVVSDAVPAGLAILDAPDVDSVDAQNRAMAAQLLASADLWVFVTSAARYADQVPWDFLRKAAERSAAVAIVLDRTSPEAIVEVRGHLARMLSTRGLNDSPLFVVPEAPVDSEGLLPMSAVNEVRTWLGDLAGDRAARARIIAQTLEGAIRQLVYRSHAIADAVVVQQEATAQLQAGVDASYGEAMASVERTLEDGSMLRGEVLSRWQEFVGAGDLARAMEQHAGRVRDRIVSILRRRGHAVEQVSAAVETGLHLLLLEQAEVAAERARAAWASNQPGRALLSSSPADLGRASRDFRERADRAVRDWQEQLLDTVRTEGADKRTTARVLAYGVNGLAVTLMVVAFAGTGGLVGAEIGIAGGSAVVGQKILEAVFGDQAVRRLAAQARDDLLDRVRALLDSEKARYLTVLDPAGAPAGAADRLRDAARAVDDARLAQDLS
jgi:GTPase SAR1 family protein